MAGPRVKRPGTGSGRPPTSFLRATQQSRGWPAFAGHDTGGVQTQQQLIRLFPRRPLADPTRCGVIDVVSRAIRSNPEAADDPLDQNIIRTVRCASAGARQAGAVVAAAAQARFNADARKWTQKTQMGRRPARIGGGSVGRPRRAPPARNPQSHSRFLRPFARICVEVLLCRRPHNEAGAPRISRTTNAVAPRSSSPNIQCRWSASHAIVSTYFD